MKKILIVDDQKITLKMAQHILSTQYKTVCALSGEEAITLYKREHPDMILTDLHMPAMSGFELQNTLQDMYAETIPVMFMTADESEDTESRSFENGAMDFIRKPFRADVLLKRVRIILENAEKIEGLRRAVETDPMTGLLNKASSRLKISELCQSSTGVLMMIDLDSFKLVNDLYGHNMGDTVLIRFAEIIRSAIRSADIAGRIGGDEFIAFCQNVPDEEVIASKTRYINEELLRSAKEYMGEDMTIPLGASIGAVLVPEEGTDFLTLYTKADKALYQVKQNGKHGYALFSERHEIIDDELIPEGIAAEMAVLGERNMTRGAYGLPYEQFRLIYRFLARLHFNYHSENRLLLFTVKRENATEMEKRDSIEKLYEIVCGSLRASDVVTQRGYSAVLVILLEASESDSRAVVERVLDKWNQTDYSEEMICEMEIIRMKQTVTGADRQEQAGTDAPGSKTFAGDGGAE